MQFLRLKVEKAKRKQIDLINKHRKLKKEKVYNDKREYNTIEYNILLGSLGRDS